MSKKKKYYAEELRIETDTFSEKVRDSIVLHSFRSQQERDAWVKENIELREKISAEDVKKYYDKKDIVSAQFNPS